jgi:hypothetical protein
VLHSSEPDVPSHTHIYAGEGARATWTVGLVVTGVTDSLLSSGSCVTSLEISSDDPQLLNSLHPRFAVGHCSSSVWDGFNWLIKIRAARTIQMMVGKRGSVFLIMATRFIGRESAAMSTKDILQRLPQRELR